MSEKKLKLLPKHKVFAEEWVKHMNSTRAAKVAGYSEKTAGSAGHRLLKNVNIEAYIKQLQRERSMINMITVDRILEEYARIAFADLADIYNHDGTLKSIDELPKDVTAAILSIKSRNERIGDSDIATIEEYKLHDKHKALEKLALYVDALQPKQDEKNSEALTAEDISKAIAESLPD